MELHASPKFYRNFGHHEILQDIHPFQAENFYHHVDPSHDLSLEFSLHGFKPSSLKFPRIDAFSAVAKFDGLKFTQAESMCLYPDLCNGNFLTLITCSNYVFDFC